MEFRHTVEAPAKIINKASKLNRSFLGMLLKEGFTTFLIDCHCGLNESAINRQQMQGKHLEGTARVCFFLFSLVIAYWSVGKEVAEEVEEMW